MHHYFCEVVIPAGPFAGRKVAAFDEGYWESDTNAFVGRDEITINWADEGRYGEELTEEEYNTELEVGGEKYFLHEYVYIKGDWQHDPHAGY